MVERPTKDPHADDSFDGEVPLHIGPFRVLERIGAGGMGVVYLAERREPVEQRAALKVIRTDRLDRTYRARFAMEQTALARMDHPNIARLLDAGDTGGVSWFAMEYVPGTPLSDYCREHRLSIEARLQIFVQICDGVQHAHMKGILHRDLKPGNVLVREIDGKPIAKIIDFGLAQPTDPLQIRATLHESMRQIVGTFAYMSPEQAQRTEGDLDTRTDVYSLGVVLYELLTGEVPLDIAEAERRGIAWIGDYLREHEPKKPSTRLVASSERATSVASERATSVHRLRSFVRGDLDWVTMKALARDRQQRYPTVRDLGREIERVLAHQPVDAGPPGGWYVTKKWLRRHVRGVAAVLIAALLGGAALAWSENVAAHTRAEAARREQIAAASYVDTLVDKAKFELWPATETMVPLLDDWLVTAERVLAMEPQLVTLKEELQRESSAPSRAGDLVLASQLRTLRDSEQSFANLRAMKDRVVGRRERAKVETKNVLEPYRKVWDELRETGVPGPRYGNLKLAKPFPGLVPLGSNPKTNCYEFYLPASAGEDDLPQRDGDGGWVITAHTGLIFVLIPGGEFFAPIGLRDEGAKRMVKPFLISRYEMTQAQWGRLVTETPVGPAQLFARLAGNVPHFLQTSPGVKGPPQPAPANLTWDAAVWVHPTQQVAWEDAAKVLPRWRLALPTVTQWWWAANGEIAEQLRFAWVPEVRGGAINFDDEARRAVVSESADGPTFDWSRLVPHDCTANWDGFVFTAPVGAMKPNSYGLHCMLGNVGEWCRDGYTEPWPPNVAATVPCYADARLAGRAMVLGGNFSSSADLRPSLIGRQTPIGNIADSVGVRPIYSLGSWPM